MKRIRVTLLITLLFLSYNLIFAQGHHGKGPNPDSLSQITVSGKVMINHAGTKNADYFLRQGNDTIPKYRLLFGPYWYQPDSGNTVRPKNGDSVTVMGALLDTTRAGTRSIIVYNINGKFWRDPFEPFWQIVRGNRNPNKGCNGFAFGPVKDSIRNISLSGKVLVDTTFSFNLYYLSVTRDSLPDYLLNFGPPWYRSKSTITLPNNGDSVRVTGKLVKQDTLKSIIVFTLNGKTWKDSSGFDNQFGGRWISKTQKDSVKFHAPFDSLVWGEMGPGWHPGGMHGGMNLPDSLFARIVELFPGSVPNAKGQNIFAAYELSLFLPNGMNAMWMGGGCGTHLRILKNAKFNLHFNSLQTAGFNIKSNTIKVRSWDEQTNSWTDVSNPIINLSDSTVTFTSNDIGNFIILTAQQATDVSETNYNIPDKYELMQNYPNPFNPSTSIEFKLKENTHVSLTIFNILGQKIATLVNQDMKAGSYSVTFDASNLPSGIYFYQLDANVNKLVKKMMLLK